MSLKGFAFGKNQSSKSKVMLGNTQAEIVSWSDKEIKVKVPENVQNGPVVVYVGENYIYESNKDVYFNAKTKLTNFDEINDYLYYFEMNYPIWRITEGNFRDKNAKFKEDSHYERFYLILKDGKIEPFEGYTIWADYYKVITNGSYNNNSAEFYFEFHEEDNFYWNYTDKWREITIIKGKFTGDGHKVDQKNGRDIIDYQGTLTRRINIKYISEESDVKYELEKDLSIPAWLIY